MRENFIKALDLTLQFEGGYVNDPDDAGGETLCGITRKNHPDLSMWEVVDHLKKIGKTDKEITELSLKYEQVKESIAEVYKKAYWDACNCDKLPYCFDVYVFDMAVNSGGKNAIKTLQKVLKISADGICGKQTIATANAFTGDKKLYLSERKKFYDKIIKQKPTQEKYRKGWYARLEKLSKI